MRILIKGGVWKNTEDEILKAAVMKYGKNQWSRISSLLVRKSAKQCKARWHEWLDPSIKKTEWSREEEEKLLHLAKLMPTQWRTIAPIVGRTAAQCLEHYERLLDQATRRGASADGDASAADDPRRLRPGEIDPNPESKPARPDPVDMDDDEKEMLSEARARLANTRGKKAKRKAREKQLEESRRLAALQKRRELKAAGIEVASRARKVRGIDYNSEIPFQKTAPAGYFDTTGEDASAEAQSRGEEGGFKATLKSKLDAPNKDAAEAKARKADAEKLKRRREEALPDVIAQINKQNELMAMKKRGRLMLPPPQVTDRELEAVVKASASGLLEDSGSDAARLLTASYDATPAAGASARTPRAAAGGGGDAVLEEAAAQAAMIASDTPLLGGESAPLASLGDFSGVTPRPKGLTQQTPNPLAAAATPGGMTPSAGGGGGTPFGGGGGGLTPARSEAGYSVAGLSSVGSEFGRTPSRDAFGINEADNWSDVSGLPPAAAKRLQKQRREALAAQLAALPAPSNEYKIVMPELEPAESGEGEGDGLYPDGFEEDAQDTLERQDAAAEAERQAELAKRSAALRRELPRPLVVNREEMLAPPSGADAAGLDAAEEIRAADQLLRAEMVRMLEADAASYPVQGAPELKGKKRRPLRPLPEEDMAAASAMLDEETASLAAAAPPLDEASVRAAAEAAGGELSYVPSLQRYAPIASVPPAEALQAPQQALQLLKNFMARDAKRAGKAEKKLDVLLGGYKKRAAALGKEIEAQHAAVAERRIELACFEALRGREALAGPQRAEELSELLSVQTSKEEELQARYAELLRTRDSLRQQLRTRAEAA